MRQLSVFPYLCNVPEPRYDFDPVLATISGTYAGTQEQSQRGNSKQICVANKKNLQSTAGNLTFIGPCIANIFSEYNQQNATFLNLFIFCKTLYM